MKNLKSPLPHRLKAKRVPLVLAGIGNVGKAFCDLVHDKREYLQEHYGLDLRFRALLKSDGGYFFGSRPSRSKGPGTAAGLLSAGPHWKAGLRAEAALKTGRPGIFVECTPSDIQTGEPGLGNIRTALKTGWHVVTANKGPLVVDFQGLRNLARRNHVSLKYSAATAAALPTLDMALYSLAGAEVLSIEGILNGTSNYILTRIGEGAGYAAALREAQEKGIAEHNPKLDVEGWDTAAKLLLIGNSVLGLGLKLRDIAVEGITMIPPELTARAKQEGKAVKLIGYLTRAGSHWKAGVSPRAIDRSHPLFGVVGTNKGISFTTDTMGSVTATGGKSDPRGAAAALLKDILHIYCPLP